MKRRMTNGRRPAGTGVLCAALAASFALPPAAMAQEQQDPPPSLVLARRLSQPSIGTAGYVQRVKQALVALSQEYPEVQTAQAAANTSGFQIDQAKKARYPRFKVGTSSGNYNSGAANAQTRPHGSQW